MGRELCGSLSWILKAEEGWGEIEISTKGVVDRREEGGGGGEMLRESYKKTLSTFLSDSNFKFVKPLSRASNQQNKYKTTTLNTFFIFCGIFISL